MVQNERLAPVMGPTLDVVAATDVGFAYVVPGASTTKYQLEALTLDIDAAITHDGTNYAVWTFKNETTGVTIAVRTWIAGDSTALSSENLMLAAVTSSVTTIPANPLISGGDILSWVKTHGGTGLATRPRVRPVLKKIAS